MNLTCIGAEKKQTRLEKWQRKHKTIKLINICNTQVSGSSNRLETSNLRIKNSKKYKQKSKKCDNYDNCAKDS